MLSPQARLCEDRAVRKFEWGSEISSVLSFSRCQLPVPALFPAAALCVQPGTADQGLCPSTAVWLCNISFSVPMLETSFFGEQELHAAGTSHWGAEQMFLSTSVLYLGEQCSSNLFFWKKRIWNSECLKILWETVSTLTKLWGKWEVMWFP